MSARPFYQSPLAGNQPYQISFCRATHFSAHWHGEIEIMYAARGHAGITVDGEKIRLTGGQAALISSAEIHSLDECAGDTMLLVIEVGYKLLGSGFALFTGMSFANRVITVDEYPRLAEILGELITVQSADTTNSEKENTALEFRLRSLLFALTAEILMSVPMRALGERSRKLRDDMLAMQQVLDYIDQNYREPIDVTGAAELSGYEKTRFCQLFKRAVGVSFHKYLNNRRIDAAKELLSRSELPIQTIADETGLPEPKTFSRVFHAAVGMMPSEYRQKARLQSK